MFYKKKLPNLAFLNLNMDFELYFKAKFSVLNE